MRNDCNIIRDILPLYAENIASEDTVSFVDEHLEHCSECRDELEKLRQPDGINVFSEDSTAPLQAVMKRLKRRIELFSGFMMIFGIFFGLGITTGGGVFYNVIIMPVVGALGYAIMRWRALYNLPILLVCAVLMNQLVAFILSYKMGVANFLFLIYYIPFIFLGIIIAALFHFAFKKEGTR